MLPHSYTVDSLSQSQDLASAILSASTPSNISAACSSVESFLHSHTPDQCRHFFSVTFPSLICKIFGFGDATAASPAQSSSLRPNGWIDVISAANDLDLAERVFNLLSPSGILMSSIFAVDKLALVKYVFPTERLPEYARFMLSSEKDRSALSNLCPFLKGKIEEDSLRGSLYEVRLNVFEYYMFWLSYYPVCRGNNESSAVNPIQKKKMFKLENWTLIKGFPGSNKRDSDHKLECNLYIRLLYSYLKAFVPVFDLNAHQPYRSSLLHYGNGYDGSVMTRAEFLVNVFVHYWLVENDFSPFPVVTAKSFGVAPPFRSAVEEIPPTCGLEEVVKLLVKYLNLSWVTSGVGSESYIEYGESPRWKTPTSGSSFHVANLSIRPLTSWNTHLQRPLYRYILRSFLFCPIGSSVKNVSQVFSIWVTYLEPWMISLDDFSDLEAALNGSVVKKEESYESRVCGYTSLWQSYVISNYLYYSSLVMHFIGFAHKFLHTDPEIITQMVLKVMSTLTSSKELLVLMKNIDKAFHSKQTGPGNSKVNELSRFAPSIREQLKDWEDGLCESNADGSFLHENWNKDLKLFSDGEDGGQQLLQLFILRAEAELQTVSEKNLTEALKCVDSLKSAVLNFFGGHVIKPIAFSLEPDNPQKNRDELFKPRGAGNQIAGIVKYKGDWMTRPVSEDEVAWMAKLLINISIWLNERLGLNKSETNKDKKENSESVSYVDISGEDVANVGGPGDAARMLLRGVVMVCGTVLQLMRRFGIFSAVFTTMAAPFFSTPFQPYVYQSQQDTITPFQILGGESQVVQIMLKSEEKVIAKPASMCYMSGSIEMENTYTPEQEVGVLQWILGKSVSSVVLRNTGQNDGFVGIAAPYLARILPIDLAMFGGEILCQPDAFLCSVHDVKIVNSVDQRPRNIVAAGAEGFLRQRLSGQGLAFILAGGSVVQKVLEVGEVLSIDVSCIAALTPSIDVQIKNNAPLRRAVFGGDNVVMATLTGPGIVFIQSLPFHRLSQRIARSVTSPNMRENPKLLIQIAIFAFLAYAVILSSLILTEV
ncbi:unnamed protein product [Arabidopsis arenosa]|uniref:Altered inheritance of mitochondria protein 24, mitochondrial n=1 Tax=Arabidopsis arenosa TaxID=38785 RepID=A0A8S2B4V5_ARAAE|nr:unnamed protein product [Arabidopsis arenosa]